MTMSSDRPVQVIYVLFALLWVFAAYFSYLQYVAYGSPQPYFFFRFSLLNIAIVTQMYILWWTREVIKKKKTFSHVKVILAISTLCLISVTSVVAYTYDYYVLHPNPRPYPLGMAIIFSWTCGYAIYAFLKKKLVPDKIFGGVLLGLVFILLFYSLIYS